MMQTPIPMMLLLLLFLMTQPGLSAPVVNVSRSNEMDLLRRQCISDVASGWACDYLVPTIPQMVARFQDTSNGGRSTPDKLAWFYTNLDLQTLPTDQVIGDCLAWLHTHGFPAYYISDGCNTDWFNTQAEYMVNNQLMFEAQNPELQGDPLLSTYASCFYQAAADAALNADAILFTKEGESWRKSSVWATVEYPALTRNPLIRRIWRVDPRPYACGALGLLWSRDRGDPEIESGFRCPFTGAATPSSSSASSPVATAAPTARSSPT